MRSKVLILAAMFTFMIFSNASAEDAKLTGEATLIGEAVDFRGNKAKFNEYRDIRSGFTGEGNVQYERGAYYLDFNAREILRQDQSYDLSGGKWGSFKYEFWF